MDDQPQPANPRRASKTWLRWLAVPAAVSLLALVYQLTRPPELVWWKSPMLATSRHYRIRAKVPVGWDVTRSHFEDYGSGWLQVGFVDRRPRFIRRLFPHVHENADLTFYVNQTRGAVLVADLPPPSKRPREALAYVRSKGKRVCVILVYSRMNRTAFNRTYKQICDSLAIE